MRKEFAFLCLSLLFNFVVLILYFYDSCKDSKNSSPVNDNFLALYQTVLSNLAAIKQQRNDLSQRLNSLQHTLALQSCEELLKFKEMAATASGGWCEKVLGHVKSSVDEGLAKEMSNILMGKTVASFGEGSGEYKKLFSKWKTVQIYDAYDGGPYYDDLTKGSVKYVDLTIPQYGLPLYDWVISMEVAHYIPVQYERVYLDNLVRHAAQGVIISWAVMGLNSTELHVNMRPYPYVQAVFNKLGFTFGNMYSERLRANTQESNIKYTLMVFTRNSTNPVNMDHL